MNSRTHLFLWPPHFNIWDWEHTRYIPARCGRTYRKYLSWWDYGRADRQSVKKPIEVLLVRSRPSLKAFRVAESITCWSRLFHRLTAYSEKKLRLRFSLQCPFSIFAEWLSVATPVFSLNMLSKRIFVNLWPSLYVLILSIIPSTLLALKYLTMPADTVSIVLDQQ